MICQTKTRPCSIRIFPDGEGSWGGIAQDNRKFVNAVFWILRTGAPWRDKGIWEKLLKQLIHAPDFEWLMIDSSHIKVHPHAAGARGGNEAMDLTKGGSTPKYTWPWMRMVCRSEFLSQQLAMMQNERLRMKRRRWQLELTAGFSSTDQMITPPRS